MPPLNNSTPTTDQIDRHLSRANAIALRAMQFGHQPFGCVIVAPDHETVLFEHSNIDTVEHAESCAARLAWKHFSAEYLWECSLYTTVEPCAMCAGTMYWANIGRLVYGMSQEQLREITGDDPRNPTLSISAREILLSGFKAINVIGPVESMCERIKSVHERFWPTRA